MFDLFRKKKISLSQVPDEVIEFLIATETGWTLDYIRSLSEKDIKVMKMLIVSYFYNAPRNQVPQI